jgi:hypothetical protein
MIKFKGLSLALMAYLPFPAIACQEILVDHPAILKSADLFFEAVVVSSAPDSTRASSPGDPARILHLKVTRTVKGKVHATADISTTGCYVPSYRDGALVTVVRFAGGEYHVVSRPQR